MASNPFDMVEEDALLSLVKTGDVAHVRAYLDRAIFGGDILRPQWKHLETALYAGSKPMIRLLLTWGAQPGEGDLARLRANQPERFDQHLRDLQACGYLLGKARTEAFAKAAAGQKPDPFARHRLDNLPAEWLRVLQAFHACGATDAVIAGGALRDTFNGKPVKDVDIFLSVPSYFPKQLIKKAFHKAGLEIQHQVVSGIYTDTLKKFTTRGAPAFEKVAVKKARDSYGEIFERKEIKSDAQAFVVLAGPERTEYNIVLLKGDFGRAFRDLPQTVAGSKERMAMLTANFDIGLCQIACDGKHLYADQNYRQDVENKTLTLVRPNHSSLAHLQRIAKKYDDWKPCPKADALLNPKPKEKPKAKKEQKPKRAVYRDAYGHITTSPSSYGYVTKTTKRVVRTTGYGYIGRK